MKRKEAMLPPNLGGSMLLVIFTVLLLSTLAMLTLSTALSQQRLSRQAAQSVEGYYAADAQAQEIYARLRTGELLPQVEVSENSYSYSCPISQRRELCVTLSYGEQGWQVLRWQEVAHPEEISETLVVWDGEGGLE